MINVTNWQIASSAMIVGLSTVDAIIITLLSGLLNGLPMGMSMLPATSL